LKEDKIYRINNIDNHSIGGDDFFRWAWGGLVLTFGGILMLSGGTEYLPTTAV